MSIIVAKTNNFLSFDFGLKTLFAPQRILKKFTYKISKMEEIIPG